MISLKQRISEKWAHLNKLDTLRLEVTEHCNLKCVHCFVGHRETCQFFHTQFSVAELVEIVREAKNLGAFKVVITGGEPLMYPGLSELCQKIKKMNFMLVIYTNGTLINDRVTRFLARIGVNMVLVSNYGTKKNYYENTTRVPGSYSKFKKGIASLKKRNIPFKQQTVLLKTNEKNRKQLWEVCKPRVDFRINVSKKHSLYPQKYRPGNQAVKDIMHFFITSHPRKKVIPVLLKNKNQTSRYAPWVLPNWWWRLMVR